MTEPTRGDLKVQRVCDDDGHQFHSMDCGPYLEQVWDLTRPVSDDEFDRIARDEGYVHVADPIHVSHQDIDEGPLTVGDVVLGEAADDE